MAALVGYLAVREAVTRWVRPLLFAPSHAALPITAATPLSFGGGPAGITVFERTKAVTAFPNAWVYSVKIADDGGHAPTNAVLNRACPLGNYGPLIREVPPTSQPPSIRS